MLKILIPTILAFSASAAMAQNLMGSAANQLSDWEDAPVGAAPASRSVTFTSAGTFRDDGAERFIDVKADADGDGKEEAGVLKVNCNGGDLLTAMFNPGSAGGKAAPTASAIAAGKTFKGSRPQASVAGTKVTIGASEADVCAS